MLVVKNADVPGVIGRVGTILGDAGLNIADMEVGRGPGGEHALMVISIDSPCGADTLDTLRAADGILDVNSIDLD